MRKVEEYRRHADECRQLATKSSNEETRTQLLQMADTWEGLARDRGEQIARQERITALEAKGDGDGDGARLNGFGARRRRAVGSPRGGLNEAA